MGVIGMPIIGALIFWRWGVQFRQHQHWLAGTIFSIAGLVLLVLFLVNRYSGCIFLSGRTNCLFDGLATLFLFLLNLILARATLLQKGEQKEADIILMLLLSSALAGMGLAKNLFIFLVFLYLFFFVLHRWYKKIGFRGGFLKLRDDNDDDHNH
jgi:NADH:ubiquinone oxidoreductase subunit 2 (subunit N)